MNAFGHIRRHAAARWPRFNFTVCILIGFLVCAADANSQQPTAPAATPLPSPEIHLEEDPTKPVFFSVRNEYRDLRNGAWANTVLFRLDRLSFTRLKNKGGAKGLILRLDVPFNTVHTGTSTRSGLGDIYAQALYLPHVRRGFAIAVGSGIVLPTATSDSLGLGKLILAPVVVPVWYLGKKRRLTFIRFQNHFSVAGKSSRPDVNYFLADPNIVHRLSRRWWIAANTEFKWDWRTDVGSGISGLQIGRMMRGKFGFWLKPEIPWGPGRLGDFNLKFTVFRIR